MSAVVLLSGGIDSTVTLTMALQEHREVLALSILYGQSHPEEVEHAAAVANYFGRGVYHEIVTLDASLLATTASSLTGDRAMPDETYEELAEHDGPSPTYVPFRNGLMLSMATAKALPFGADEVWAGMHSEDAAHWAYPDCTPEFIGGMANAIYVGTYHQVRLRTPLQWMTKTDVIRAGIDLAAPLTLTLSCYRGYPPCGTCPTCVSRIHAFAEIGIRDPADAAVRL